VELSGKPASNDPQSTRRNRFSGLSPQQSPPAPATESHPVVLQWTEASSQSLTAEPSSEGSSAGVYQEFLLTSSFYLGGWHQPPRRLRGKFRLWETPGWGGLPNTNFRFHQRSPALQPPLPTGSSFAVAATGCTSADNPDPISSTAQPPVRSPSTSQNLHPLREWRQPGGRNTVQRFTRPAPKNSPGIRRLVKRYSTSSGEALVTQFSGDCGRAAAYYLGIVPPRPPGEVPRGRHRAVVGGPHDAMRSSCGRRDPRGGTNRKGGPFPFFPSDRADGRAIPACHWPRAGSHAVSAERGSTTVEQAATKGRRSGAGAREPRGVLALRADRGSPWIRVAYLDPEGSRGSPRFRIARPVPGFLAAL